MPVKPKKNFFLMFWTGGTGDGSQGWASSLSVLIRYTLRPLEGMWARTG